jgi:hypothetical protein
VSQRGSSPDDGCAPGAVVHVRTAVAGLLRLIEENTKTGSIHGMGGPREGWNRGESHAVRAAAFGIIVHELTAVVVVVTV